MRVELKGIHTVKRRLANGEVRTHYYAWRGGPPIEAQPGTPEFLERYDEAHRSRKRPSRDTFSSLMAEFKASAEYAGLAASTKRAYAAYFKLIEAEFGDLPIAALDVKAGTVVGKCMVRHRTREFRKFLDEVERSGSLPTRSAA